MRPAAGSTPGPSPGRRMPRRVRPASRSRFFVPCFFPSLPLPSLGLYSFCQLRGELDAALLLQVAPDLAIAAVRAEPDARGPPLSCPSDLARAPAESVAPVH